MPQLKTYTWKGLGRHITKSGVDIVFDASGNFTTDKASLQAELDAEAVESEFLFVAVDPITAAKSADILIQEAKDKLIAEAQAKVDAATRELADTFKVIEDAQAIRDANKLAVDFEAETRAANIEAEAKAATASNAIAAKLASLKHGKA
jgi:hypothetical protein